MIEHENHLVQQTGQRIANILDREIEPLFKPGVEITLIVRSPGFPARDMVITSDDLREVQKTIERRVMAENSS